MKPQTKKIMGFHYSNEQTFQIVALLEDKPGALGSILQLIGSRVNIISNLGYRQDDGRAICSAFVKPLQKNETEGGLRRLIESSPLVKECVVTSSDQGLLTDSYHSGIEASVGRRGALIPSAGISQMFNRLVTVFQSGGETILFEEGSALGKSTGEYLNPMLHKGELDWKVKGLVGIYRAIGWGVPDLKIQRSATEYSIRFAECFECSEGGKIRSGCWFLTGHLTNTLKVLSGENFVCKEVECVLRGDPLCEFHLAKRQM